MEQMETDLTNALIDEMKFVFGADTRRINHALDVLAFAQHLQQQEGGDKNVVEAAAVLHDIGIHEAERKYGSAAGNYQEIEGPPIARTILDRHNVDANVIDHICEIVAQHHSAKTIDTLEFRIVWDADWLVNIPDELGTPSKEKLCAIIEKTFKTNSGRKMAKKMFLDTD
jgi:HD superfamily phosphodiesterase